MALPAGVPTVTVVDSRSHPDGTAVTGRLTLTPDVPAISSPDRGHITTGPAEGRWSNGILVDTSGARGITVLAADAPGYNPTGWTYTVQETPSNGQQRTYSVLITSDLGPTVDLADIAPVEPYTGDYVLVPGPEGPAGPPGADGAPGAQGPPGTPPTGDQVGVTRTAYKPTDENVASSIVLQADDHLSISVTAGAAYAIDGCLIVTGDPAGDFALTLAAPPGSTGGWTPTATTLGTTDGTGSVRLTRFDFGASSSMGATAAGVIVNPLGGLIVGATGTIAIQWAQAVSSATPTTIKAGSWIRLTRM